jgi:hypothetical protein
VWRKEDTVKVVVAESFKKKKQRRKSKLIHFFNNGHKARRICVIFLTVSFRLLRDIFHLKKRKKLMTKPTIKLSSHYDPSFFPLIHSIKQHTSLLHTTPSLSLNVHPKPQQQTTNLVDANHIMLCGVHFFKKTQTLSHRMKSVSV